MPGLYKARHMLGIAVTPTHAFAARMLQRRSNYRLPLLQPLLTSLIRPPAPDMCCTVNKRGEVPGHHHGCRHSPAHSSQATDPAPTKEPAQEEGEVGTISQQPEPIALQEHVEGLTSHVLHIGVVKERLLSSSLKEQQREGGMEKQESIDVAVIAVSVLPLVA